MRPPPSATDNPERPVRVLQVVAHLDCGGGVQERLRDYLRLGEASSFAFDFLLTEARRQALRPEFEALGAQVFQGPDLTRPIATGRECRRILRECGPYDAVHCHLRGTWRLLREARRAGVAVRLVHHHIPPPAPGSWLERLYDGWLRRTVERYATGQYAVSTLVAAAQWGANWAAPRRGILPFGIPTQGFETAGSAVETRRELGLPDAAFVVGHVGRLDPVKNHELILAVARELPDTDIYFLLVGDGPLRAALEARVDAWGLRRNVIFSGYRDDAVRLLRFAMDCLIFPSFKEGLAGVLVEAQAAGLPVLMSDSLAVESMLIPELVTQLSPAAEPRVWAQEVLRLRRQPRPLSPALALTRIRGSKLSAEHTVKELLAIYRGGESW